MGLNKLGKYIELFEARNSDSMIDASAVVGLSTQKQIIPTQADLLDVNLSTYKLLPPHHFAYVPDTSRRGDKMSLGYNTTDRTYLVSSISVVFKVKDTDELAPDYLYMYFNRPEFDRYARFNSWGSAREAFSWEEMCDIRIDLPPLPVQNKYVAVYNALSANHKACECGLDDLKLTCDAYIERLRRETQCTAIGKHIRPVDERNINGGVTLAQGVNVDKVFIPAKRVADDIESGRIVRNGQFAYNKVMKANGTKLPIALRNGEDCFVSGSYQVFEVINKEQLLPEYLMMWLSRTETERYAGFISWGSTRDILDFETLCEIAIPIPDIKAQESVVNIYNAYITRREISERLNEQLKNICPILIKGAIDEARIS